MVDEETRRRIAHRGEWREVEKIEGAEEELDSTSVCKCRGSADAVGGTGESSLCASQGCGPAHVANFDLVAVRLFGLFELPPPLYAVILFIL